MSWGQVVFRITEQLVCFAIMLSGWWFGIVGGMSQLIDRGRPVAGLCLLMSGIVAVVVGLFGIRFGWL